MYIITKLRSGTFHTISLLQNMNLTIQIYNNSICTETIIKPGEVSLSSSKLHPGIKRMTYNREMKDVPILSNLLNRDQNKIKTILMCTSNNL